MSKRFLVVDDHEVIRNGLVKILHEVYPSAEIQEANDAETAIKASLSGSFDLIISDLSMPGRSGLDLVEFIKENFSRTPVLILSMHPEEQYAIRALRAGAWGYLGKDAPKEVLIGAMQQLLQGRRYISPLVSEKLIEQLDQDGSKEPHEHLSDREFEVFKLIATGKSVTHIAEALSLSITTISTYRSRILAKLNINNNADLTRYAMDHELI